MTAASETCAIVPIDVEDIMAKLSVSEKMSLIAGQSLVYVVVYQKSLIV